MTQWVKTAKGVEKVPRGEEKENLVMMTISETNVKV